jgi:hypothetical protein
VAEAGALRLSCVSPPVVVVPALYSGRSVSAGKLNFAFARGTGACCGWREGECFGLRELAAKADDGALPWKELNDVVGGNKWPLAV